jgi:hypothetical protein
MKLTAGTGVRGAGAPDCGTGACVRIAPGRQVASSSPAIALEVGRQSLARGFSEAIIPFLYRLNLQRLPEGRTLYSEVLAKLKTGLTEDPSAVYFAQHLALIVTPPVIDVDSYRQLINLFVAGAIAKGCQNKSEYEYDDERWPFCHELGTVLPLIRKFDPSHANSFKQWEDQYGYRPPSGHEELNQLAETARR